MGDPFARKDFSLSTLRVIIGSQMNGSQPTPSARPPSFDVFLSYNSRDRAAVEGVANQLRAQNLTPFLDRWYLGPGLRWRPKLEESLASCKGVAVFIGPEGMGSWQQREVDVALDRQSQDPAFTVIPVLLPGCEPPLGFLRQNTWVDLRRQPEPALLLLTKAVRGEPPGPDLVKQFAAARANVCPYRGLLYFREEDAPFFFGRDQARENLAAAVRQKRFLAVVGASGSGKSSVVRAGLVPQLRRDHDTTWEVATLFPGDQPLKALAAALLPFLEPAMTEIDRLAEVGKLAGHFASGAVSLRDVVQRILTTQPALIVSSSWPTSGKSFTHLRRTPKPAAGSSTNCLTPVPVDRSPSWPHYAAISSAMRSLTARFATACKMPRSISAP